MPWDKRFKPKPWGSGKTNMKERPVTQAEYEWVIKARLESGVPLLRVIEETGLGESTIKRWCKWWNEGRRRVPVNGRPRDIDEAGKQWLEGEIEKLTADGEPPQRAVVAALVLEASKSTAHRQDRAPKASVSKKQLQKVIREVGLETSSAEITTEARKVAKRDPLSFVSTSALFYWFFRNVPNRNLLWNYDAMTFAVGSMDEKKWRFLRCPIETNRSPYRSRRRWITCHLALCAGTT